MTYDEIKKQLDSEYDRAIRETLAKLKKKKPLTKHKLAELLFKANKAYWAARLALLDSESVDSADRLAMSLAVPYATAAQTFSDRVRNIYAGYQSAFDLTQEDAKELLDKVVYDRTIAESLQKIAEDMPEGEDKTRILAEISAPAYRYRLQRAEQLAEQAKEVCHNIARGEIDADRKFLQTETEKAYNITVDEALRGTPADAILDEILPEPIQLRFNEMPKASEPVQDFTPTEDKGVLDSFSLTSTKHVSEITETDWKGRNFSDSVWNNTDKLAQEIKQVLIEGELTGKSEADMAAKIVERFEVGMHAARRVVRTESNYCTNQAELKGMKDAGFDEYEFISLGEEAEDVCRVCDDLNGQRFKIADAVVGVNCPPMHPFCRCKVTTPQETEEDIQREIDERIDSWNMPEGMSLDEFVERVNNGELEQIREEQAENTTEATQPESYSTLNSVQESAEENIEKTVDNSEESGIIKSRKDSATDKIDWLPKGENISSEQFKDLRSYAVSKGFTITRFKKSDVDIELVKEGIEKASTVIEKFPELKGTDRKVLTLNLSYGMKANDFAETRPPVGHIIHMNGNAFRDKKKLSLEYQRLVDDKWFVQGTNYNSVIIHELGHLYQEANNISDKEIVDIAINVAGVSTQKELFDYLSAHLSCYSALYDDGREIISEVFSDYFNCSNPKEFSVKFMNELLKKR